MIQLKVRKDNNIIKYISILRKYDKTLSLGEIKKRIENDSYIIEYDLCAPFDIDDDLNNKDRNIFFRELIYYLISNHAIVEIYQDNNLITVEILDNFIERIKQIELETIIDIDRELE